MDMFVSLVQLPIATTIVTGVLVAVLLWVRASSIHSVLDRLWRLLGGDADIHDEELKAFMNERRDVERFRFLCRIKLKSYIEIHALIGAVKTHSLDFDQLTRARYWLRFGPGVTVKIPSGRQQLGMWVFVVTMYLLLLFSVKLIVTPYTVLMTTREPSISFLISSDLSKVRSIAFGDPVDLRQCDIDKAALGGQLHWGKQEVETICNARKDLDLKSNVEQGVLLQRWLGALFALVFCFSIFVTLPYLVSVKDARQIKSQLNLVKNALK